MAIPNSINGNAKSNAKTSSFSRNSNVNERIVLNVGGVKYETYRSTLTAYPDTLLGTMFQTRNEKLLHPTTTNPANNISEYFIDRNGRAFHYVMEYYRSGKVVWGGTGTGAKYVTRRELEEELDYFLIPPLTPAVSLAMDFETSVKTIMKLCIEAFNKSGETHIKITAPSNGNFFLVRYLNLGNSVHFVVPKIASKVLCIFGQEVYEHLKVHWPNLRWEEREIKDALVVNLSLRKDLGGKCGELRARWH